MFPSTVFLHNARQNRSSTLLQFQTSISNHLDIIFVIGQHLVDSSVAACWLQFGTFVCPFCNCILVVSWITVSKFQAKDCLVW